MLISSLQDSTRCHRTSVKARGENCACASLHPVSAKTEQAVVVYMSLLFSRSTSTTPAPHTTSSSMES